MVKGTALQQKLNETLSRNKFRDKTAIESGNRAITYAELDKRSNRVANWIKNKGIIKETSIGVFSDDRVKFIIVVIGILKARCVFVPLDFAHPKDRLETMIDSTDIKFIIGDTINLNRLLPGGNIENIDNTDNTSWTPLEGVEFISIDNCLVNGNSACPIDNFGIRYSPEDKIYIYFTSGSTGVPKAFVGKNISLLHFIHWEIDTFAIPETFRISQLNNPGFDAFLRDMFVPLCSGGVICIPEHNEIILDPDALTTWLERSRINLAHFVPVLFRAISANGLTPTHFKHVKFILLSGEKIKPTDLVQWYKTFGERIKLVNLWGTSETTLAKTCYFIKKSDVNKERIPVGKPIKGARVVVLDDNLGICKNRTVGNLYIRTPYRTFGYYDPELNKGSFIQNPFNTDADDLLHKTGDLGRLLSDGNIEVLGRSDRQVKIRGIRIELEEIESVLSKHSLVKEAAVIKKEICGDNALLYAYVTGNQNNEVNEESLVSDLSEYLLKKLPDYMIPAHIIKMEEIPRNPNGKIDYQGLPDPIELEESDYIPPRNATEKKLVELWGKVLELEKERIGIKSRFFKMGGNSLKNMSLISKIHKEFGKVISLGEIFKYPTIEKQAEMIEKIAKDKFIPIEAAEEKEYYELSAAQKRLYFIHQIDPEGTVYNIFTALEIEGSLDIEKLGEAFWKLIKRHENFRTSFYLIKNVPIQKIHPEVTFNIDYFEAEQKEKAKIVAGFKKRFDLTKAPLLKAGVIKFEEEKFMLMIDMHHIVSDGTSMDIFIKDFIALYHEEVLTVIRCRYRDFAEWQNRLLVSDRIKEQEKYWLNRFSVQPPPIQLPVDFSSPSVTSFKGKVIVLDLGKELSGKIYALAKAMNTTLFMVLLSVYFILLSKYTGREDIVIGIKTTERAYQILENTIGMFVNMLAIRNRPRKDKIFKEFLEEVNQNALESYENRDYPFQELVKKLRLKRKEGRNPLFDTVFGLRNVANVDVNIDGLKITHYEPVGDLSNFDLHLEAIENEYHRRIFMELGYSTNLFKTSTAQKIINRYIEVLKQVIDNIDIKIGDITISQDLLAVTSNIEWDSEDDFTF